MRKAQKQFILKNLIPFILRESGRGFGMSIWNSRETYGTRPGHTFSADDARREVPACGTICCIGGSVAFLKHTYLDCEYKALGLSPEQAHGLFYNWDDAGMRGRGFCSWPTKFVRLFEKRKSPLGKAKVAVALLKEVVRTNGKCLNPTRRNGNYIVNSHRRINEV